MQRWPNRDPIGEDAGVNLYGYAANNPIIDIDTDGLRVFIWTRPAFGVSPYLGNHTVIVLIPDNTNDFTNNPIFALTNGAFQATLEGQMYINGVNLFGMTNYSTPPVGTTSLFPVSRPPDMTDTQLINNLLGSASSYNNNLLYGILSGTNTNGNVLYNSGSYTCGVISATGVKPPTLPVSAPGYQNPPKPIPLPHYPPFPRLPNK